MTSVPKYLSIVADCAKWGVEDRELADIIADKAGLERADIEALSSPLSEGEQAWAAAQSIDAPQVTATQKIEADIAAIKAEVIELREIIKNTVPDKDDVLRLLGLTSPLPYKQDEALAYAVRAFTNAHDMSEAQRAPLTKRKWDMARFDAALARARAAQASNDAQEKAKADAKAATTALYDKLDALDALYRPIAKEMRRVLVKRPDKLGLLQLDKGVPAKPARPVANRARKPQSTTGQ